MNRLRDIAEIRQGLGLAGRGAGRHPGDWVLRIVESRNVRDGRLSLDGLAEIGIVQSARTERHLLRPNDLLVTARAGNAECALVPPGVSRTVAGVTLLVVRPQHPESGIGHYLWYFFNSAHGRPQLSRRMTTSSTLTSLSARDLGEIEIPLPSVGQVDAVARLVEAAETAYNSEMTAARLRREILRDAILAQLMGSTRERDE